MTNIAKSLRHIWPDPDRRQAAPVWTGACIVMMAALLAPAIWNGFPVVFYDTGGYLERPFERTLLLGRSALYGAFLALGIPFDFWPNVAAQAALVMWLLLVTLRVHGLGNRPRLAVAITLALCVLTGLPWYAAQLMPDIFVPAAVLALHLLAFRGEGLRAWERVALAGVVAVAVASHMSILALIAALLLVLLPLRWFAERLGVPRPALAIPALALALGIFLALFSNLAVAGRFALTPGGANFLFARLVQDGIAQKYLGERCPDDGIRLCQYRDDIAGYTADDWLWDAPSPFFKLGGAEEFEPEARRILGDTLVAYPALHLRSALAAAASQLIKSETGDGLTPWSWHTQWTLERFAPQALTRYLASRQAQAPFDFSLINVVHEPVALLSLALLPLLLAGRRPLGLTPAVTALIGLVFLALLGNAAICGIFSNPHDRYQSRLAWLAVLALAIAVLSRRKHRINST